MRPGLRPGTCETATVVTEDDVRRIALNLPGAFERTSYGGRPSWRTTPRMFAWVRDEPEALVIWVDSLGDKEALVASEPEKFFTTPHYDGHPVVLVRLEAVDLTEVSELITDSWRLRAPGSLTKR
ncbi:MAG: MmcQ/YjbR family DNA-binding protein [Streptosporangiales bacterium]